MTILTRIDRHAELLDRMADTLGIDVAQEMIEGRLTPDGLDILVDRCMGCSDPEACQGWLDAKKDGADAAPIYCVNGGVFAHWPR